MNRQEFDRLLDEAAEWMKTYVSSSLPWMIFDFKPGHEDERQVLLLDIVNGEVTNVSPDEIDKNDHDYLDEGKMEVNPSNWVSHLDGVDKWYPVRKSTFRGVLIEISDKVWAVCPREMIYEQR